MKSLKNGYYYIGSTNNKDRRLKQHNGGFVQSTKNIKPLTLVAFIKCENITQARKAEYKLKKYKRRDILEKVIKDGLFPWEFKKMGL